MNRIFCQSKLLSRPLAQGSRFSSTSAAPSQGGSKAPLYVAIFAAAAAGSYYILNGGPPDPKQLQLLEQKAKAANAPIALSSEKFLNFKLKDVQKYNHDTSKFIFELPEGHKAGLTTCSAIIVKSATEGQALGKNGKPAIRPYTPISDPDSIGHMDLLIKNYKDGLVSKHIHSLKPGDELSIKGPIPKFQYKSNEFEHVALIAGGSGITPMYQLIDGIAKDPADKTKVTLIYANKTEADILLREEFDELAKKKPEQFKVVYTLDTVGKDWTGLSGFVDREKLEKYLPKPVAGDKIKIFVCGPPGQMEAVSGNKNSPSDQGELKGVLANLGYQPSQVYKF